MRRYEEIEKIIMKINNCTSCEVCNSIDASIKFTKILSDLTKDYDNGTNVLPFSIISAIEQLALLSSVEVDLKEKETRYYIRILVDDIYMNLPADTVNEDINPPEDGVLYYLLNYIKYKPGQDNIYSEFCENFSSPSECGNDYIYYLSKDGFSVKEISELLKISSKEVQNAIHAYSYLYN